MALAGMRPERVAEFVKAVCGGDVHAARAASPRSQASFLPGRRPAPRPWHRAWSRASSRSGLAPSRSVARLRRQTRIKFGAAAAELVSDALRSGTTETELDRIDDWIVECGSADELLARLRAGQSDSGNGSPEGRPR